MNIEKLLMIEEGFRAKPYYCSEGYPTIGVGTKIGKKGVPLDSFTFTVNEITAKMMLIDELDRIMERLESLSWYNSLSENRQIIIESMCYQMGVAGVLKFRNMIRAIEAGDFRYAAVEMLNSRWARQTEGRALRHADVMELGHFGTYNK